MEIIATVEFINNKNQSRQGLASLLSYCSKESKTISQGKKLVSGTNCVAKCAYSEFMNTKLKYGKTGGRMFYHLVQSFSPEEKITPELAHKIAVEFANEQLKGYEVLVGTHTDKGHIHSHFVINSVNSDSGRKYHSDKDEIQKLRNASDKLCLKYGLSVIDNPSKKSGKQMSPKEYRSAEKCQSWKVALAIAIDDSMRYAKNKNDFKNLMKQKGYEVRWTDERKYITYTCPNQMKCRDIKLHEEKYLKGSMENEFERRKEILFRYEGNHENSTSTTELYDDYAAKLGRSNKISAASDRSYEVNIRQAADYDYRIANAGFDSGSKRSDSGLSYKDGERYGNISSEYVGNGNEVQYGRDNCGERPQDTGWEYERQLFKQYIVIEKGSEKFSSWSEDTRNNADNSAVHSNSCFYLLGNFATLMKNQKHFNRRRMKLSQKEIEKRRAHGLHTSGYDEYEEYENDGFSMSM